MKKTLFASCLLALISAMGCHDLVAPNLDGSQDTGFSDTSENYDTDDVHTADVTQEEDADATSIDDVDDCTPEIFQCSDTFCGIQTDNCGDPVVCAPCGCTTSEDSCGLADLGVQIICGQDEDPGESQAVCDIPEIPGLTEELLETSSPLLYVDKINGNDSNHGQKEAPLQSIQKALVLAQASHLEDSEQAQDTIIAIIVAGDTQTVYETNSLELISGVSLIGGYDSNFKRVRNNRPTIRGNTRDTQKDESIFGLIAENITHRTVVHNFHVTTMDAPKNTSAYAIYARDADALVLDNITTKAGKGGDGQHGTDGKDGSVGANGRDGTISTPGTGGINHADCEPVPTQGGNGGQGQKTGLSSKPAQPGSSAKIAKGGDAGKSGVLNGYGGDGESAPFKEAIAENGVPGLSGGEVDGGLWMASGHGTGAKNGIHGTGGGGGGGGTAIVNPILDSDGNSGGGGGAGGCAGTGGGAGKAGGASFGLFLVHSDIEIKNSALKASSGGKGGDGGKPGKGGAGGKGGKSAQEKSPYGGTGGDGSAGTAGGHGGAGAGGASYGAYCHESAPEIAENVVFIAGTSAPGGQGPTPDESGGDGITEDSFGCTP